MCITDIPIEFGQQALSRLRCGCCKRTRTGIIIVGIDRQLTKCIEEARLDAIVLVAVSEVRVRCGLELVEGNKEKQLVLDNWAAQGEPVLLFFKRGYREVTTTIKCVADAVFVLTVIEGRALQFVSARLSRDVD